MDTDEVGILDYDAKAADEAQNQLFHQILKAHEKSLNDIKQDFHDVRLTIEGLGKSLDALRRGMERRVAKHEFLLVGTDGKNGIRSDVLHLKKEVPDMERRLTEELKRSRKAHVIMTISFMMMMISFVSLAVVLV